MCKNPQMRIKPQCGRLSQLSWLLGALEYSYLLTYLLLTC